MYKFDEYMLNVEYVRSGNIEQKPIIHIPSTEKFIYDRKMFKECYKLLADQLITHTDFNRFKKISGDSFNHFMVMNNLLGLNISGTTVLTILKNSELIFREGLGEKFYAK